MDAAMDIEGVGEQLVRRLWREGIVTSMPDLYRLTWEQLAALDRYGETSARKAQRVTRDQWVHWNQERQSVK